MWFDLKKCKWRLIGFVAGIFLFTLAAEKSRQQVGEDASSKSGKFTWINCFDMGSGTAACLVKEGIKFYVYNLRAGHVERARQKAYAIAYSNALKEGVSIQAADKQAERAGGKAGKLASRQARRVTGPIIAGGWDLFEAVYYGGTVMEGTMRALGTIIGTYLGGFQGERKFGRIGYLIGSHLGSWFGARLGLMVYDISAGLQLFVSNYLKTTPSLDPYVEHTEDLYSEF